MYPVLGLDCADVPGVATHGSDQGVSAAHVADSLRLGKTVRWGELMLSDVLVAPWILVPYCCALVAVQVLFAYPLLGPELGPVIAFASAFGIASAVDFAGSALKVQCLLGPVLMSVHT